MQINNTNNKDMKIVTVTLNPALDLTGHLSTLTLGAVNVMASGHLHPAGKGVNVAKVLADLGASVTVTGFLGESNQASFTALFDANGINDQCLRVPGSTRINVKIVEQNGQVSDLNFPGMQISSSDIKAFEVTLFGLAECHDVFVFSGSLPQGLSAHQCYRWIKQLQQQGKKVVFDSSKLAFSEGINACPWLVKPNDEELAEWAGVACHERSEILQAAERLASHGIEHVVVSLGEKGVMWRDHQGWLQATPQTMDVVSTVGAGDTLVAGLCWGQVNGWNKAETLRFATALSAYAVTQVSVGVEDLNQVFAIEETVILSSIEA